ncbi:MAG: trypsin-like peptidase domain-containing protein [Armatimonadota bacterium]
MLDLNTIDVRALDTEGLAAVVLLMLRERIEGVGTTRGHPSSWPCIVSFYLSARWEGYRVDGRSGVVRTGTETHDGWQRHIRELDERALTAIELLRRQGLIQQDPRQTHAPTFVVPTEAGRDMRIDTEPPQLGIPRDARWVRDRYGAGVLHITGRVGTGDEAGGTVFWLEGGCFVTCAHNLDLREWSVHHPELRLTEEHLEAVRHGDENCDAAVLRPRTPVVGRLGLVPIKPSEREVADGESGFAMGYPAIPGRQPVLMVANVTVVSTSDYRGQFRHLTFTGALAPGYSGGPVFDSRGYVIGINSEQTFDQAQQGMPGFGHAVPVEYLRELLR